MTKKSFPLKRVLLVLGIVALIVLYNLLPAREWLKSFNEWVAGLGALGMILFVFMYIAAAVLMLPGSVLTLGAGFAFGLVNGMIAVSLGSTLGAGAAFLVGRYLARNRIQQRFADNERFTAVDEAVAREGWKIVFLLRLSPAFPYVALNYLLGLTKVRFFHFLLASWIGMLPGTLLYVYIGFAGRQAGTEEPNALRMVYMSLGLLATLLVTIYITKIARRALNKTTELENV
jgi:uncharacterized membrane protein YdjX (TVP38/TMEM64 family)